MIEALTRGGGRIKGVESALGLYHSTVENLQMLLKVALDKSCVFTCRSSSYMYVCTGNPGQGEPADHTTQGRHRSRVSPACRPLIIYLLLAFLQFIFPDFPPVVNHVLSTGAAA